MLLFRLFILFTRTFSQILYHESFTSNSFSTSEEWVLSGQSQIFSDCGTVRLFGGYGAFGKDTSATKLLQLPPHHTIQITLEFWKIDSWDNEVFFIYLDQISGFQQNYGSGGTQHCGLASGEIIQQIVITKQHNFQSLFILLTSDLDEGHTNGERNLGELGISNYIYTLVHLDAKHAFLQTQENNAYIGIILMIVQRVLILTALTLMVGQQIKDINLVVTAYVTIPMLGGYDYTGKQSYMFKKINLAAHSLVKIKFRFIFIDTWNAENAYFYVDNVQVWTQNYDYQNRVIQNLCGSFYDEIPHNEEITIAHSNSQITLIFSTDLDQGPSNESFGIRDIQIYIPCIFGSSFNQACGTICGNGVQEQFEQCDDGNIYAFDGCYNCQYSCVEGCSNCIDGICFECDIGWIFQLDFNTCIAIVDDKEFQIWEECDDQLNFEICKNGKFICPSNCLICQFGICFNCKQNYELINNKCESICQNQLIVNDLQCNDYNLQAFDKCHQCYYELEEGCKLQQNGICIDCLDGWILQKPNDICIPLCGDLIIQGNEQCDINTQLKQSLGCNQCFFDCQNECIDCKFGICQDCMTGWKLINQQCQSNCGDNQVQGLEDCDDMNFNRFDGCNKCSNDCQRECSYCFRGICLNCIYGWHLNDHFICEPQCGDSQIALITNEECEDFNDIQFDGCYQCQLECCHYCDTCVYGVCYKCEYTFTLVDQFCIPICGDGLVTIGFEQCDDMNQIPYDGCYQCNYQCRRYCKLCIKGICYDHCENGFYEFENECLPICGDGIIVDQEDCDDQNEDKTDGCNNCIFQCPDHCEICVEGKCKLCEQGYELHKSQNQCLTFCGNGLVSIEEECDDMNKQDGDGCSKECKIEPNYVCQNYQYSFTQCTYEKYPQFKAFLLKQDYQKQYVSLHFDQQVKVMDNIIFSEYIELNLIGLDHELYNITLNIIQEAQQFCLFVEYIVEIDFYTTLSSPPILEVILNEQLYNQNEAPLINQKDTVRLNLPKYIDDQQQQSALILKNMGTYVMNSMGAASILVLLLGNSFILKGVIEVLQQQSYLRFINVVFPLNLYIYFESSNIITIKPLLDFFNFNTFTSEIVKMPFIESYEKLKFYEINADLINNLQTQIFLSLSLLSTYLTCFFLVGIFKSLDDSYYFYFGSSIANVFMKIQISCLSIKREIEKQGLREFLISNCWDLLFISFLQIHSQSFTSARSIISVILAYLILYVCVIIISSHFYKENKEISIRKYWFKKFDLFLILKKLLFVVILVLFQRSQQIQSLLLTLICSLYLIYIIYIRSQRNILEYINLLMMEISVFIFCLTVALYWSEMENNFDYKNQVHLGWFHIAMLLCVLITNLGLQLIAVLIKMKKVILKKLQKPQNQNNQFGSDPYPLQNVMQFKI